MWHLAHEDEERDNNDPHLKNIVVHDTQHSECDGKVFQILHLSEHIKNAHKLGT